MSIYPRPFQPAEGGGGGGASGDWNTLTPSDLQIDAQSYSTFTLAASPQAGFDNRITIATTATGVFNNFPRNNVGVAYFDTGFSVDDLADGDSNNAVIQVVWEPYGMAPGSTYTTDVAYPLGVCLFSSLSDPPFSVAPKGGFFGHGFLHTKSGATLRANDAFVSRMRNQTTANLRGTIYSYGAGTEFKQLVHTVTMAQGITGLGAKALCLTQGDFMAYYRDTTAGQDVCTSVIGQQQDNTFGFSTDPADTVKVGVMFNMFIDAANGGVNPSPSKIWDFNLKWRKLSTGV